MSEYRPNFARRVWYVRTSLPSQRPDIDLERRAVDELVSDADLCRTGDRSQNSHIACWVRP